MSKKNRPRKMSGFADTKEYPHKNHPANYRKKGRDDIEYLTFTHHDKVEFNNKVIDTIPLDSNISPKEREICKSYVYPKVFIGKRSMLGKEDKTKSFTKKDKEKVDELFKTLPKEKVTFTSNSNKYKNK